MLKHYPHARPGPTVAVPHPDHGSRGGAHRLTPARRLAGSLLAILLIAVGAESPAAGLPDTLASIKPGGVAVGTFMAVRAQRHQLRGSGFAYPGVTW